MTQTKPYPSQMMPLTESYQEDLIRCLQNPVEAAAYLETALEPADVDMLPIVLNNLVAATAGQHQHGDRINHQVDRLQTLLNNQGTETLATLVTLINLLGFQLSITPNHSEPL